LSGQRLDVSDDIVLSRRSVAQRPPPWAPSSCRKTSFSCVPRAAALEVFQLPFSGTSLPVRSIFGAFRRRIPLRLRAVASRRTTVVKAPLPAATSPGFFEPRFAAKRRMAASTTPEKTASSSTTTLPTHDKVPGCRNNSFAEKGRIFRFRVGVKPDIGDQGPGNQIHLGPETAVRRSLCRTSTERSSALTGLPKGRCKLRARDQDVVPGRWDRRDSYRTGFLSLMYLASTVPHHAVLTGEAKAPMPLLAHGPRIRPASFGTSTKFAPYETKPGAQHGGKRPTVRQAREPTIPASCSRVFVLRAFAPSYTGSGSRNRP